MNPINSSSVDSWYFVELRHLTENAPTENKTKNRIKNIFEWHSDSLIADLLAHPEHRKTYRIIGAELRRNDLLMPFQSSIGTIQKIARLLENQDIEGLEKLSHQVSDVQILQKFSHLTLISDPKEIRKIPHASIRAHVFAAFINRHQIPIKNLNLTKNELMEIGPHLSYLDCKDAFDDSWNASEIFSFLKVCINIKTLKINSPIITKLPYLQNCEEIETSGCINLDPQLKIYEEICDTIGQDFFDHLNNGSLHLHSSLYSKLTKNDDMPLKIHLRSSEKSKSKESIEKAKSILADILQSMKSSQEEIVVGDLRQARLTDVQKKTCFFQFIEIAIEKGKINENFFIRNLDSFDQNERFQMAKFCIKTRHLDAYFDIKNLLTEERREVIDRFFESEVPVIVHERASKAYANKKIFEMIKCLQDYESDRPQEALLNFPGLRLLEKRTLAKRTLTDSEIEGYSKMSPYYEEVKDVVEKICEQRDEYVRNSLIDSLSFFLLACQIQNIPPGNLDKAKPLIKEFFDFRDPDFRFTLLPHVIETLQTDIKLESFVKMFTLTGEKSFTSLISMLVVPHTIYEDQIRVAQIVKIRKHFQNNKFRNPFIKNLAHIVSENSLTDLEKNNILHHLLFKEKMTSVSLINDVEKVAILMKWGKVDAIKNAHSIADLDIIVDTLLDTEFELATVENGVEKFFNTFGSFPKPNLVLEYGANLKLLPDSEREIHLDCLRDFVRSVVEGNFHELRYETDKNDHLRVLFGTNEGARLKEEWMRGARFDDAFGPVVNLNPSEKRKAGKYDGYVVTDTDDPYHLLSLGEIAGSCQNVAADINNSKALLSTILDGKNRAMIVQDNQGEVVARCILRLLWDIQDRRIVLVQEPIYPRTVHPDSAIERAIVNSCKRRAAELNLPLLSTKGNSLPYKNVVYSLGGRAPSEYIDSNRIGKVGNVWSLRHLYQVPWKTPA